MTPLFGLIAPGEIYTVSINESGQGMIGGGHLATNVPYAAIVNPNGTVLPLSLPASGLIYGVAIENSGYGIIGGVGPLNSAYGALVSPTTLTPLAGLPTNGGIFWVAANDSGRKFIGGKDNTAAYAAFVTPSGTVEPVSGLPQGLLYSVAINNAGTGLIGGTASSLPYVALIDPNGTAKTIFGLPATNGIIYNVTLNNSGTGLIAGFSAAGPYGSFVAPDGTLTPLKGLPTGSGFLDGAAIHATGVGIVGGSSAGVPFAALVAPNGNLTYLEGLPADGEINSIAISVLDNLVPKSIGTFDSWANTQFALSNTLTQHCMIHHRDHWLCGCCEQPQEISSVWMSLVGNYVRERARQKIPSFSNKIAGAIIGLDYGTQEVVVGGGLAYAFNDIHYFKNFGCGKVHQESAVLYASWDKPNFYLNVALWGSLFQTSNERRSFTIIRSRAKPCGWNLNPHVELSTSFPITACQSYILEPLVMFDWANNWQNHYREKGSSGFNIRLNNQYASILRSEVGVRLYEKFQCNWGCLIVEEKVSYVNRTPFQKKRGTASFIGAISSFDVATCSSSGQNHGLVELHLECKPSNAEDIYASLDYQGEFGSSFQSQSLTLSLGKNF